MINFVKEFPLWLQGCRSLESVVVRINWWPTCNPFKQRMYLVIRKYIVSHLTWRMGVREDYHQDSLCREVWSWKVGDGEKLMDWSQKLDGGDRVMHRNQQRSGIKLKTG